MVAAGHFRADLYYRLNVFTISLPPLRQRRSDLPLLVDHLLEMYCREFGKPRCRVSSEAMELIQRYWWPGNVRELQRRSICAMLHARGPELIPEYFPADRMNPKPPEISPAEEGRPGPLEAFIEERLQANTTALYAEATAFMERILLTKVLRHTGGNQSHAALILDITRGTLRSKIRELGICIQQTVNVAAGNFECAAEAGKSGNQGLHLQREEELHQIVEVVVGEVGQLAVCRAVLAFDEEFLDREIMAVVHVGRSAPEFDEPRSLKFVAGLVQRAGAAHVMGSFVGVVRPGMALRSRPSDRRR